MVNIHEGTFSLYMTRKCFLFPLYMLMYKRLHISF